MPQCHLAGVWKQSLRSRVRRMEPCLRLATRKGVGSSSSPTSLSPGRERSLKVSLEIKFNEGVSNREMIPVLSVMTKIILSSSRVGTSSYCHAKEAGSSSSLPWQPPHWWRVGHRCNAGGETKRTWGLPDTTGPWSLNCDVTSSDWVEAKWTELLTRLLLLRYRCDAIKNLVWCSGFLMFCFFFLQCDVMFIQRSLFEMWTILIFLTVWIIKWPARGHTHSRSKAVLFFVLCSTLQYCMSTVGLFQM